MVDREGQDRISSFFLAYLLRAVAAALHAAGGQHALWLVHLFDVARHVNLSSFLTRGAQNCFATVPFWAET